AGGRVIDPGLAAAALAAGPNPLTSRECEVLRAAAAGDSVADIAAALALSEGTVRNYLSAAIAKTCARNRVDAARVAAERGWLSPRPVGRSSVEPEHAPHVGVAERAARIELAADRPEQRQLRVVLGDVGPVEREVLAPVRAAPVQPVERAGHEPGQAVE